MIIVDVNGNKRECQSVHADAQWPGYMIVEYVSKTRAGNKRQEWYAKTEFIKNNPNLANFANGTQDIWKEDLGIVTLASSQTLTDKKKQWNSNEFAAYPIWISRGKGEGQTKTITMNTNDTIIIDTPWEIVPDETSQYVISHNVHNPQVMGNTLPAGSGDEQKLIQEEKEEEK